MIISTFILVEMVSEKLGSKVKELVNHKFGVRPRSSDARARTCQEACHTQLACKEHQSDIRRPERRPLR